MHGNACRQAEGCSTKQTIVLAGPKTCTNEAGRWARYIYIPQLWWLQHLAEPMLLLIDTLRS